MANGLRVARTLPELRREIMRWKTAGEPLALVPTMGALHAGHIALVRAARLRASRVVVSIFVNPAQFAPEEDLASYPRTIDSDLATLAGSAVDLVWAPAAELMYQPGFATRVVPGAAATVGLEDRFRPHFFTGVATVVAKLLIQCAPDFAMFGEKDYQQLQVVTQMAKDLDLLTEIVPVPTVRETDGLALSSRNAYLMPSERAVAATLHRVLKDCAGRIANGEPVPHVLALGRGVIERAGFMLDYFEARRAKTLSPLDSTAQTGAIRLLLAARLGKTRLIDNLPV